ncbi:MAG: type II toxin-antitoxin system RatA family toxin [Candidatus Tectimicrobiota bacterium]
MHTENTITMRGDIERIFALASAVEDWPRILPHYRWVNILTPGTTERLVEMAAHRDGFPVHWTARQQLDPLRHQIHFTHVRGISRGMDVTWFLEADGPQVHVRIVHDLAWGWAPLGPWFARYIIGDLFVHNIASKTLRVMKQHIESMAAC